MCIEDTRTSLQETTYASMISPAPVARELIRQHPASSAVTTGGLVLCDRHFDVAEAELLLMTNSIVELVLFTTILLSKLLHEPQLAV
mmetsp:Transcript_25636/g.74834  ORF Transcript_25636/g.74834 Transcript_25636/m.74834 type:complete len:87 (-) Transcript_25636:665-925(-)